MLENKPFAVKTSPAVPAMRHSHSVVRQSCASQVSRNHAEAMHCIHSHFYLTSLSPSIQFHSHPLPSLPAHRKAEPTACEQQAARATEKPHRKGRMHLQARITFSLGTPRDPFQKKEITLPKGISTHTAVPGGGKAAPKAPSSVIFSYSKAGFGQHPSSMNKPPPPAMHSIPLPATSHLCLEHQHVKICSDLKRKATCRDCGHNVTSSQNLTPIINPSTTTNSQRQGKGLGESKKGKRESKKLPSETTYAQ